MLNEGLGIWWRESSLVMTVLYTTDTIALLSDVANGGLGNRVNPPL